MFPISPEGRKRKQKQNLGHTVSDRSLTSRFEIHMLSVIGLIVYNIIYTNGLLVMLAVYCNFFSGNFVSGRRILQRRVQNEQTPLLD